jgi:hypothetical protein
MKAQVFSLIVLASRPCRPIGAAMGTTSVTIYMSVAIPKWAQRLANSVEVRYVFRPDSVRCLDVMDNALGCWKRHLTEPYWRQSTTTSSTVARPRAVLPGGLS